LKGIASPEYGTQNRQPPQATLFDSNPAQASPAPPAHEAPVIPDPAHQRIWDLLASKRHGDELAREAGLSVSDLSRALTQMELRRLVRRLPGNFYERR
jgi:DNA processing protein